MKKQGREEVGGGRDKEKKGGRKQWREGWKDV